MSFLIYCVTETSASNSLAHAGVGSLLVETVEHNGLRCFVSESKSVSPKDIRDDALIFHRVLKDIFQLAAIIPFRFPTILSDHSEVIAHLTEHSKEYTSALSRLRDLVQMELSIQFKESGPDTPAKLSGTEYLRHIQARRAKLEMVGQEFRQLGAGLIKAWRQRDSTHAIRCFALIDRTGVKDFQREIGNIPIHSELTARLSGPWPATQFLTEE
jgi:Gas vesicle synthesis protein GvpL/GvpF